MILEWWGCKEFFNSSQVHIKWEIGLRIPVLNTSLFWKSDLAAISHFKWENALKKYPACFLHSSLYLHLHFFLFCLSSKFLERFYPSMKQSNELSEVLREKINEFKLFETFSWRIINDKISSLKIFFLLLWSRRISAYAKDGRNS